MTSLLTNPNNDIGITCSWNKLQKSKVIKVSRDLAVGLGQMAKMAKTALTVVKEAEGATVDQEVWQALWS